MTEYGAKRNTKRCPTHPGGLMREVILPAMNATFAPFRGYQAFRWTISFAFGKPLLIDQGGMLGS
jgi:hypothetical protein